MATAPSPWRACRQAAACALHHDQMDAVCQALGAFKLQPLAQRLGPAGHLGRPMQGAGLPHLARGKGSQHFGGLRASSHRPCCTTPMPARR